jgi:hypothetical protein
VRNSGREQHWYGDCDGEQYHDGNCDGEQTTMVTETTNSTAEFP